MLFRVLSLFCTKNPVTLGLTFSIAAMSVVMKAWEFFLECLKNFAVFDVKVLVVPVSSMWKLNTCGPLEAFLRALSSRGGSDQASSW